MPPRPRRRLDRSERSLVCLIQSLEGRRLVIELRNDVIVRGHLDSADDFMNMMLSKATIQSLEGTRNTYDFMYLKGRNVRFVHLPAALDPGESIAAQRQKIIDARLEELRYRLRNPLASLAKGDGGVGAAAQSQGDGQQVLEEDSIRDIGTESGSGSAAVAARAASGTLGYRYGNTDQWQAPSSSSCPSHEEPTFGDDVPYCDGQVAGRGHRAAVSQGTDRMSGRGDGRGGGPGESGPSSGGGPARSEETGGGAGAGEREGEEAHRQALEDAERDKILMEMEAGFDFELGEGIGSDYD